MKRKKKTCREKSKSRIFARMLREEIEKLNRIEISGGNAYTYVLEGK